jgi:hypothetical protein
MRQSLSLAVGQSLSWTVRLKDKSIEPLLNSTSSIRAKRTTMQQQSYEEEHDERDDD